LGDRSSRRDALRVGFSARAAVVVARFGLDPDAKRGFDFTSQLYFDDALTDIVHAQEPYAARGARRLRNGGDGIFRRGGTQLLLAPTADGTGGYSATFEIALDV